MVCASSLADTAGLTQTQVARLLGSSVRAMSHPRQADRVRHLTAVIKPFGTTPRACRRALLASGNGRSIFHQLVDEAGSRSRRTTDRSRRESCSARDAPPLAGVGSGRAGFTSVTSMRERLLGTTAAYGWA
ncbi:hypothetical protein [Curtobacterium sp. MCBD17_040]|uniref:hypothetical protein n=1 Tax=Curtobacterium sp. MCBD17_040 TaxID=2175674 RepID=UPI000DA8FFA9|nr:hypothetical protein [Curtobacterium sp. MCBD17_040]WIB65923.1 hypothetical protein DEI94_17560 [Curtobacterium sp. MCBD17_040]